MNFSMPSGGLEEWDSPSPDLGNAAVQFPDGPQEAEDPSPDMPVGCHAEGDEADAGRTLEIVAAIDAADLSTTKTGRLSRRTSSQAV